MKDKATKRREIANKLTADIPRLRKEIADRRENMAKAKLRMMQGDEETWFSAWSRGVGPLAAAIGRLRRCERRLPYAVVKAEDTATAARERKAIAQRIQAANVGLMRRLDQLKEGVKDFDKRSKKERRAEERRVARMKAIIAARTAYTDTPEWMLPPLPLPPPIEQPDLSIAPEPAPPRADLLPGTYRIAPIGQLLDDRPAAPTRWTWQWVGERLIEAHRLFKRLPASVRPKGYGTAWPAFQPNARDLADAEAPVSTMQRSASPEEIARANEAIQWPLQFLSGDPMSAQDVNLWAMQTIEIDEPQAPVRALSVIAEMLNAAGEAIR